MNHAISCTFFILVFLGATAFGDPEPKTLFFEGVAAFNKGDLEKSEGLLNQYLAQRPRDAHAHINMATLQTKRKNWGLALGHLRIARTLDPQIDGADSLEQELQKSAPPANGLKGPFHKIVRPFVGSLSPLHILILALFTFTAWGHFLVRHLKSRKWAKDSGEPLPSLNWFVPTMAVFSLCFLVLYAGILWVNQMNLATVVKGSSSVYSAPDGQSFELGTFGEGAEVKVLNEKEGWTQVSNGSELSGWVQNSLILKHKGAQQ